jgi:hypothetical protein
MSHLLVSDSSPAMRVARRAAIGVALVTIGYFAALLASISVAIVGEPGSGNASDAGAAAPPVFAHGNLSPEAASTGRMQNDFDYFPDHYNNQAREVAEQPPTF